MLGLLALLAASGCGDNLQPAGPQTFTLLDGSQVVVEPTGQVTVMVDDRPIFVTSPIAWPTVRRFDETAFGPLAIWDFTRQNEVVTPLDRFLGARQRGSVVSVEYADASGAESATLYITPHDERVTVISLAHTGPEPASSLAMPLECTPASSFYGFGGQYNKLDQRGEAFSLWVSEQGIGRHPDEPRTPLNGDAHTTYFPMPYFLDARGFGALIRTSYRVDVDLCARNSRVAWFEVASGQPFEWLVFHGPELADVIDELGAEVGRPRRPPAWAYDLWIGAQGGTQTILEEAGALRATGIPAGTLWVQDWSGVRPNASGGSGVQYRWRVDPELYENLRGLVQILELNGYRFLVYVNPFIDTELDYYPEMADKGFLIKNQDGEVYHHIAPNGMSSHPDLTNPEAWEYVKTELRYIVLDFDVDGWMVDFGEWLPIDARLADGSDAREYHNRFAVDWMRMSREVMDQLSPEGNYVLFARAGFTGAQAHAQIYWVGDQEATFSPHDGLPTVVPAMLNLGLSGLPFVTHDIAGFSGGPSTKELFLRWTELGAFTPIMRTHEGDLRLENWSWDSDTETILHFRRFARIHQALIPELVTLGDQAAQTSMPMLRPLVLTFPDDLDSRGVSDEFMLGRTLLVAPVLQEGVDRRSVYLPPGTWYHVWSGEAYEGGRTYEVGARIGEPPVFSLGTDRPDLRAIQ